MRAGLGKSWLRLIFRACYGLAHVLALRLRESWSQMYFVIVGFLFTFSAELEILVTLDSFLGKFYVIKPQRPKRLNQSREIVPSSRNHVLFYLLTYCVRLGAKSCAKTKLKVRKFSRILSPSVNVFLAFTLNKFKSTLKRSQFFFKSVFLWSRWNHLSKPVILTSEREQAKICFSEDEVNVFLFSL